MRILFLYVNPAGYGRIPLGVSLLVTILHNAGHVVEVFDTTFMSSGNSDNDSRQKSGFVADAGSLTHLYECCTETEIESRLESLIGRFKPDLVAASIVEDNYLTTTKLLKLVKRLLPEGLVVVGGPTPTVVPEIVIENPWIDMLVVGEGEEALLELCSRRPLNTIKNLWWKEDGYVYDNPVRPFIDMDTLPVQDLSFWNVNHMMKPYNGKVLKSSFIEMSRGCTNKCSYCINAAYQTALARCGSYFRRKSVKKVIAEALNHKQLYGVKKCYFTDDNFLYLPIMKLEEFASEWKSQVDLPFWINTTAETISVARLDLLKSAGCDGVTIGIESGSAWLRENVLNRKSKTDTIIRAFRLLKEYGIRSSSNIMLGFPGESEAMMLESISLLKLIQPDSIDVSFVTPYGATALWKLCKETGTIDVLDEPGFKGLAKMDGLRKPSIRLPDVSVEKLEWLYANFADMVRGRVEIPVAPTLPYDNLVVEKLREIIEW